MEYDLSRGMLKLYKIFFTLFIGSFLNASTVFDFDLIKKGQENNNTLLVIGGIQGDEPGGFISASLLATHYEITEGSLWIVPNLNFYSIIKRSRGPYGDMNRKFAYLSKSDPEYATIQRIKSYIEDEHVKLIVNLHDGSGFYREHHIDATHSPYKWGQCSIIDQKNIIVDKYGNLEDISLAVVGHVNENLIKELLTVLDDFEMANTHAKNKEDLEGLNLIHKNLLKILEKFGLKKIETKGKKFDHNYHEVLLKEPSDKEEGVILEELQAGYLLNGKVIRHSKVKISGGKTK